MIRLKPSLARILAVKCDIDKAIKNGLIKFHSWFVRYQDKHMKEMLLYPVRQDAGLGYDFSYNNNPESVHRNLKVRQNYKATEMPTFVENIRKEKNANLCYVEDAVIGNGPFGLALEFIHFNIDQFSYTYH